MKGRKPVLYALIVIAAAGAVFGARLIWLHYFVLRTNDARIEGTMVGVASRLADRVTHVLVKEGDTVAKGHPLIRIESRNITARRASAQATLLLAEAQYEKAKNGFRAQEIQMAAAQLEQTEAIAKRTGQDLRRLQTLARTDGGVTQAELDAARAAHDTAKAAVNSAREELSLRREGTRYEDIEAAKARVEQAKAELDGINAVYEDILLCSPVNGTVAQKLVSAGEIISVGQRLLTLVDADDMWMNARIEETRIGQLHEGQTVAFTLDGYPGKNFSGTIYEISPAVSSAFSLISTENVAGYFTKVMQRVPIKITLPDAPASEITFRVGMQGTIHVGL
ncbi:MAG: Colistin resistance protein EmrA [Desulfovibrio sp.]